MGKKGGGMTATATVSVKERLGTLLEPEYGTKAISSVQAYIDPSGGRWLWATQGHAMSLVRSDEQAELGTATKALIEQPRTVLGYVQADELLKWAGKVRVPKGAECKECGGAAVCYYCGDGKCPSCDGTGRVASEPEVRPGRLDGQRFNRNLVARALTAIGKPKGEIKVSRGAWTGHGISRGAPVWFEQDDWQAVVMPMQPREDEQIDYPVLNLAKVPEESL